MKCTSEFECGSGKDLAQIGPMRWRMSIRADQPGYDHYFMLRLSAGESSGVAEIEVHPDSAVPPAAGLEAFDPIRPAGLWRRRGSDGPWERVPQESFETTEDFLLVRQPVRPGEVWDIGEVCPAPFSDLARHVQDMPNHCPHVRTVQIGETPEKRPLLLARVTDARVPAAEKGRVFILAGQHGTEFAGCFAAKVALDFAASSLPEAASLRRRYVFDVLLCANPDGNAHGLSCLNSEGKDQFTAFAGAATGQQPATAEADLLWRYLAANVPDVILNFHAYPQPRYFGDPPHEAIYVPSPEWFTDVSRARHQRVLNHALFYLTGGGSQHRRPCPARTDTLEHAAAMTWDTLSVLYQVQAQQGPHQNLLTGVHVLRTALDALEMAQAESEGI